MPDDSDKPTWRELAEFIDKQSQKDRDLIDKWFERATKVLGILIIAVGVGIAFFGWKTLNDASSAASATAKTTAEAVAKAVAESAAKPAAEYAAHGAAIDQVAKILEEDQMKKLVRQTARDLLAKGEFRQATEDAVRAQLLPAVQSQIVQQVPDQVTSELRKRHLEPRQITDSLARTFRPKLQQFRGKKVAVYMADGEEATAFGRQLQAELTASGLIIVKAEMIYRSTNPNLVMSTDQALADVLCEMIGQANDGVLPAKAYGTLDGTILPSMPDFNPTKKIGLEIENLNLRQPWPDREDVRIYVGVKK